MNKDTDSSVKALEGHVLVGELKYGKVYHLPKGISETGHEHCDNYTITHVSGLIHMWFDRESNFTSYGVSKDDYVEDYDGLSDDGYGFSEGSLGCPSVLEHIKEAEEFVIAHALSTKEPT